MKSIRNTLIIWLLTGLILVWGLAGAALYYSVKVSAEERFDRRLRRFAQTIRARSFADEQKKRRANSDELGNGSYFQVWDLTGQSLMRSITLDSDYPRPPESGGVRGIIWDTEIEGTPVRALYVRIPKPQRPGRLSARNRKLAAPVDVMVAFERGALRETLISLIVGILGTGIVAGGTSIGLIHFALQRGLRPLNALGQRLSEIDERTLDQRFSSKALPHELIPVADKFDRLLERLEAGFLRERRFSADLAHELRTPVAELKMLAEVAQKWPEDTAAAETALSGAHEIADQMETIIDGILTLARHEGGSQEPVSETVDLEKIVKNCWKLYKNKNEKVSIEFDGLAGATIEADSKLLRIVVGNLLSNAACYTPDGGEIRVSVPDVDTILQVANTAEGTFEGDVEKMFERLWRGDSARANTGHYGLGLPLARACAKACNFQLEAKFAGTQILFLLKTSSSDHLNRLK